VEEQQEPLPAWELEMGPMERLVLEISVVEEILALVVLLVLAD
jgi:hypothetical protein